MQNPYLPYPVRIDGITVETEDKNLKTFKFTFLDPADEKKFAYKAGQFAEYSVFGEGECTFCIASSPTRMDFIECSYKQAGKVTKALTRLGPGDVIGFRGPYGNSFPLDRVKGKHIVFIAGDVVNEEMSDADLDRMSETLRKIESRTGVFACPGNHEFYAKLERSLPALRRGGVDVLQDEFRIVAGAFIVVGRGSTEYLHSMEKRKLLPDILAGADLALPVILLDHQPARLAESAAAGADLQLSGHTHAGQLIPYAWLNAALWDVGYGYGRAGNMQVYVTSGAGFWGPPVRIGTNSEIVHLKITFQAAKGEPPE